MRNYYYASFLFIGAILSACQTTQTPTDTAISTTKNILNSSGDVVKQTGEKTGEILKAAGEKSVDIAKTVSDSQAVKNITQAPTANNVDKATKKQNLGDAALSPLNDANIRRAPIPEKLLSLNSPYDPIEDKSCAGLNSEMLALSAIIGPELDTKEPIVSNAKKNRRALRNTYVELTEAAATSFIPFRSVVRLASGAKKYERKVRHEYRKGIARRAYLRGIFDSQNCAETK